MKNKIVILIIVLILIGFGGGVWYYQNHQKSVNLCKDNCSYIPPREAQEKTGGLLNYTSTDKGDYWLYSTAILDLPSRKFETQDQCIDYCLSVK